MVVAMWGLITRFQGWEADNLPNRPPLLFWMKIIVMIETSRHYYSGIMLNFHCKSWAVTPIYFGRLPYNDELQINDSVIC